MFICLQASAAREASSDSAYRMNLQIQTVNQFRKKQLSIFLNALDDLHGSSAAYRDVPRDVLSKEATHVAKNPHVTATM